MKQKFIYLFIAALVGLGLVMPLANTEAVSGVNIDDTDVRVYTKQGGDWFLAREKETDSKGVLRVKDILPGKYRMTVDDDDQEVGQFLAINLRMLDDSGRRLKEETDVDLYVYVGDTKVFISTVETDEDGWLKVEGLSLDTVYYMDVDDDSSVKKKDGELRIKIKSKIDDSDWFPSSYSRTEDGILKVRNVLPGKYKFKAKDGSTQTFVLKAQVLDEDGKIVEDSKVKLYAYMGSLRVFVGEVMTDDDGWMMVPNVSTNMKYKVKP